MWRLPATLLVVVTLLIDGTYQVRAAAFDDDDDDSDNQVVHPHELDYRSVFLTACSPSLSQRFIQNC